VIDPFQNDGTTPRWPRSSAPASRLHRLPAALSSIALAAVSAERASFALIYVDGSHLFEDVIIDACSAAACSTRAA
jgi:hypothetical protein